MIWIPLRGVYIKEWGQTEKGWVFWALRGRRGEKATHREKLRERERERERIERKGGNIVGMKAQREQRK